MERVDEGKTDWFRKPVDGQTDFVHCANVKPTQVRMSQGLDRSFARENVTSQYKNGDVVPLGLEKIESNAFIFAAVLQRSDNGDPIIPKLARTLGFGAGGYMYIFRPPATEFYASTGAELKPGIEIGFPADIDITWINEVWAISKQGALVQVFVRAAVGDTFGAANQGCCCCYITTATCNSVGKSDDCTELAALRGFRDNVLAQTPDGRRDIARYYQTAPKYVAEIDAQADASTRYSRIFADYIAPSVAAIYRGDMVNAERIYREMLSDLSRQFPHVENSG